MPARALGRRCRAQRGNGKARTARGDFLQPPTMSRGAAYPPLCPPGPFFGGRSAWTTGCPRDRPPRSGCPRLAPAPPRRPRADGRSARPPGPGHDERKPCDRVLPVLGAQSNIVRHMRGLSHQDVAAAVETVRTSGSAPPAVRLAFESLVLTAAGWQRGRRDGRGGPGVDDIGGPVWDSACGRRGWRADGVPRPVCRASGPRSRVRVAVCRLALALGTVGVAVERVSRSSWGQPVPEVVGRQRRGGFRACRPAGGDHRVQQRRRGAAARQLPVFSARRSRDGACRRRDRCRSERRRRPRPRVGQSLRSRPSA